MKKLFCLAALGAVAGLIILGCQKSENPVEEPLSDQSGVSKLASATTAGHLSAQGTSGRLNIFTLRKTDEGFLTCNTEFVPIPNTQIPFSTRATGLAVFYVTATEKGGGPTNHTNAQLGVRVDGVDLPLAANDIHHPGGTGVNIFKIVQSGVTFMNLLPRGNHIAEVVIRGNSDTEPASVRADAQFPLNFVIQVVEVQD